MLAERRDLLGIKLVFSLQKRVRCSNSHDCAFKYFYYYNIYMTMQLVQDIFQERDKVIRDNTSQVRVIAWLYGNKGISHYGRPAATLISRIYSNHCIIHFISRSRTVCHCLIAWQLKWTRCYHRSLLLLFFFTTTRAGSSRILWWDEHRRSFS